VGVTDGAIDQIKGMIVSGELGPGDRLPREADLAERLGLSRNSLREAVRALTLVRILDVRQGDGTYVTTLAPDVLLDAVSFVIDLHQDRGVLDLLEVRRILEAATAALAARNIDPAGLAELERLLEESAGCGTIEELVENDLAFHRTIGAGSGNSVLASLLDGLSSRTSRARIWRGITQSGVIERTIAEHRAIYEAIAARRPELAEAAMTVHVGGVEEWLRQALGPGHGDASAGTAPGP